MDYKDIINQASERVKDIKSDIRSRTTKELLEYYFVTYISEGGDILTIKIDECDYQLYFDIKRQPDNSYALLGEVEILVNSSYIGMLDKELNFIPPDEE